MNKCPSCQNQLSEKSIFCSKCKTQVKCLNCKEELPSEAICCEVCGTDVKQKTSNVVMNRIKYDGQSFEAEFTDTVGKDVTETFGQIFISERNRLHGNNTPKEDHEDRTIDISATDVTEVEDGQAKPKTNSVKTIFKFEDGKAKLIETRIKGRSKLDYSKRVTYLLVLYFEARDEAMSKSVLNNLLEICGLNDGNYRTWFGGVKKTDFLVEDGSVEFRPAGRIKAESMLKDVFDDSVEDKWDLSMLKAKSSKTASSSKSNSSSSKSKPSKSSSGTHKIVNSLDLHPKGKDSLKDFYSQYAVKTFFQKNLLFVYYLQKVLSEKNIGIDHIYTCYKKVGERVPGHLKQSLIDTKKGQGWIETENMNDLKITVPGENAVEHDFTRNK